MPEPYGQRIKKVVPGAPSSENKGELEDMLGEEEKKPSWMRFGEPKDNASEVEGDTFPDAPSSHENPSVFYDPLAL